MIDVSILRKKPADRRRTIHPFPGDNEIAVDVLLLGSEGMKEVNTLAKVLVAEGVAADDAYNCAFGRVAIKGWSGLLDGGEPLELCAENVDLLMVDCGEFRSAVLTAASSLQGDIAKN